MSMTQETPPNWADIKKFEEILKGDPHSYCFAPLAELYRKMGLVDDALNIAQKGCEIHPEFASGQMALARACFEKGLQAQGLAALEKVVRITPENLEAQKKLSQIYLDAADYGAAKQALAIILSLNPNDVESQIFYNTLPKEAAPAEAEPEGEGEEEIIYELTEEIVEEEISADFAEAAFPEESPAPQPELPVVTATMAELYARQGFTSQAAAIYRELLAREPDNPSLLQRLQELTGQGEEQAGEVATGVATADLAGVAPCPGESPQAASAVTSEPRILATLEQWLDNIRRVRAWRSKSV